MMNTFGKNQLLITSVLCFLIFAVVITLIAEDYSGWTLGELIQAAQDTAFTLQILEGSTNLTSLENQLRAANDDLDLVEIEYILAAAVKLALETKLSTWQAVYNGAYDDYMVAEGRISDAKAAIAKAEEMIEACTNAMKAYSTFSEEWQYWFDTRQYWYGELANQQSELSSAQEASNTAFEDMVRIAIIMGNYMAELERVILFSYNPLAAERSMLLSQISTLNTQITDFTTRRAALRATAAAIQAEIDSRN